MTNWSHHKETHILKISTRRRTIEGLFKNTKSKEFHLESTHVTCPDKLEKLMAVIAVATALCIRTGQWQEKIKPTIYKKTVKAPLYSTFRRGFDALRRWLTDLKNILTILYTFNPLEKRRDQKMSSSELKMYKIKR